MDKQTTVVIADSAEEFSSSLVKALQRAEGFQVLGVANDGEMAQRMVIDRKPDILVIDLMLAKKDGISVLKALTTQEHRPAILVTSSMMSPYMGSTMVNLGVNYLVVKPCDMTALVERLEEIRGGENPRQNLPQSLSQADIETMVTNIIHEIGVPAHIK